jgi:hypothetical protein
MERNNIREAAYDFYRLHESYASDIADTTNDLEYVKEYEPDNLISLQYFSSGLDGDRQRYDDNLNAARAHKDAHLQEYIELAHQLASESIS